VRAPPEIDATRLEGFLAAIEELRSRHMVSGLLTCLLSESTARSRLKGYPVRTCWRNELVGLADIYPTRRCRAEPRAGVVAGGEDSSYRLKPIGGRRQTRAAFPASSITSVPRRGCFQ